MFHLPPVSNYNPGEILMFASMQELSAHMFAHPLAGACRGGTVRMYDYEAYLEDQALRDRHQQLFFRCFRGKNAEFDFSRTTTSPWPSLLAAATIAGDRIVTFAQANIVSNGVYSLENVMVDPGFQHQGFSRVTIENLMHRLKPLAKWVLLTCDPKHEAMYAKYGFFKVSPPKP